LGPDPRVPPLRRSWQSKAGASWCWSAKVPAYHIGESLCIYFPCAETAGLLEKMRRSAFVKKYSVQFVSPNGKASQPFYFFNRYDRDTSPKRGKCCARNLI